LRFHLTRSLWYFTQLPHCPETGEALTVAPAFGLGAILDGVVRTPSVPDR
jgi:hypothetical protein